MYSLKNINIGRKIGGGFGVILFLLVVIAGIGFVAQSTIDALFAEYRALAEQTGGAGQIKGNLLEARVEVGTFIRTGSPEAVDMVTARAGTARTATESLKAMTTDQDDIDTLSRIEEGLATYVDEFGLVVKEQNRRDAGIARLD